MFFYFKINFLKDATPPDYPKQWSGFAVPIGEFRFFFIFTYHIVFFVFRHAGSRKS
jgi:hypothetical protein